MAHLGQDGNRGGAPTERGLARTLQHPLPLEFSTLFPKSLWLPQCRFRAVHGLVRALSETGRIALSGRWQMPEPRAELQKGGQAEPYRLRPGAPRGNGEAS